jgi:hypothetical protein
MGKYEHALTKHKAKKKRANAGHTRDKGRSIVDDTMGKETKVQVQARADFASDFEAGLTSKREADGSWWRLQTPAK